MVFNFGETIDTDRKSSYDKEVTLKTMALRKTLKNVKDFKKNAV